MQGPIPIPSASLFCCFFVELHGFQFKILLS
jgi:hypothetical protein